MIDTKTCEWLMDNADAPIRYRVARELLNDDKLAKSIENELLDNSTVKLWLKKLKPENPPQNKNMIHGAPDYYLENAMFKIVQFGLHAELPPVADAVKYYMDIIKNTPLKKPCRKYNFYINQDLTLLSNMLTIGEVKDSKVLEFMLGSLNELYEFASKGNCDIYLSPEERGKLKSVPPNYIGIKHFTKPKLFDEHGICWPLVYDIFGLTKLYGAHSPETDKKIDAVIDFISNDDFHNTIPDGYGVLTTTGKTKYYSHGWDPKYPGWFNIADYFENASNNSSYSPRQPLYVPKLLFFAMYIVKYPIALKTKWFSDLLCCLEKYKTENGTYIFPKQWLTEKTGYAVLGSHMSFGESRRKKNWQEIESTFYMQLLNRRSFS